MKRFSSCASTASNTSAISRIWGSRWRAICEELFPLASPFFPSCSVPSSFLPYFLTSCHLAGVTVSWNIHTRTAQRDAQLPFSFLFSLYLSLTHPSPINFSFFSLLNSRAIVNNVLAKDDERRHFSFSNWPEAHGSSDILEKKRSFAKSRMQYACLFTHIFVHVFMRIHMRDYSWMTRFGIYICYGNSGF